MKTYLIKLKEEVTYAMLSNTMFGEDLNIDKIYDIDFIREEGIVATQCSHPDVFRMEFPRFDGEVHVYFIYTLDIAECFDILHTMLSADTVQESETKWSGFNFE